MVRMWASLAALFLAILLGAVMHPRAAVAQEKQTVSSLLKRGQAHFDEQEYEESIQVLSAGLMRPGTSKPDKIQIYTLLAYNYIVLQRNEEADGAVRGLLVLDPEFALPDTESPRFRDFFDKVRKDWEDEGRPGLVEDGDAGRVTKAKIKHISPAQVDPGAEVELDGVVEDPDAQVAKINLYYRQGAKGRFNSVRVKFAMRKFTAQIPASAVEPPLVEYYVEALDSNGLPVTSRGDAASPLRIAVTEESSVLTSPWLWVPVGVTVVAAVVIIAVVASSGGESTVSVNVFE